MKRWRLLLASFAAAALFAAAVLLLEDDRAFVARTEAPRSATPSSDLSGPALGLSIQDCAPELRRVVSGIPDRAEPLCGKLLLRESPERSLSIELGFARIPAKMSKRTPLLILPGGPGDALIPGLPARLAYLHALSPERDLLFVDQRGTGTSRPRIDCQRKLRRPEDLKRCYEEFNTERDLSAYSTSASSRDLAATLAALKLSRVAVLGVSYGTRLGSVFAGEFPEFVETLILDSPMPVATDLFSSLGENAQRALGMVLDSCAGQQECAREFSVSLDDVRQIARALDQKGKAAPLSAEEFVTQVSYLLYSPQALKLVPLVISQGKAGKFEVLSRLSAGFQGDAFAFGVHLSVQCAEIYPLSTPEKLKQGEEAVFPELREALGASVYTQYCLAWKVPPAPTQKPPEVRARTLVLSGTYDPVTPVAYGELVCAQLTAAGTKVCERVVIPGATHGASLTDCGARVVRDFLAAESLSANECLSQSDALHFATSVPKEEVMKATLSDIRYRL